MSPVDRWLIRVAAAITLALILGGCDHGLEGSSTARRPVDDADCVALGGVYSDAACRAGGPANWPSACDVCILPWAK